jgi:hypothetical protein
MIAMSKEIRAYIDENCPDALIIGTGEEHDSALIGTAKIIREDEWVEVAMYSYDELIKSFTEQFRGDDSEDPEQDALEWVDYNVVGAYMGKYTPYIVYN